MAKASPPPPTGIEVEVRHRGVTIRGKVIRSTGRRFAVEATEPIDLETLLAKSNVEVRRNSDFASRGSLWHWRDR